ncbi:MAG: hypothetical protein V4724_02790 [Pseudomonadota bacterium]
MDSIRDIFTNRTGRLLAAGLIVRIIYDSYDRLHVQKPAELVNFFKIAADGLPDYYLEEQFIDEENYKVIAFSCGQFLISIISEVELFLSDIIINTIIKYPKKIGKMNIDVSSIIQLGNYDEIIKHAAEKRVIEIMYKNPAEYKKDFLTTISAPSNLLDEHWEFYTEAKARRDLGIHNNWKINDTYKAKTLNSKFTHSDRIYASPSLKYVFSCRDNCVAMMDKILIHCEGKI